MGLDLTKQGNLYQKTNVGRNVGLVGGSAIGYKFLAPSIKNYSKECMKMLAIDTFQNGNIKSAARDAKWLNKLSKNSGVIGTVVAAIVCAAIGGAFDDTVNSIRAKKADKKAL